MNIHHLHPREVSLEDALDIQARLASEVSLTNAIPEQPHYVVGTDVSPPDASGMAWQRRWS